MPFRDPDWDWHCADLAVGAVDEATGRDVWAELGGRPTRWKEAADLYRRNGCSSLADLVTLVLGDPIDRRWAHRGDIAMADGSLGIVRGELVEFANMMKPLSCCARAWRVPRGA